MVCVGPDDEVPGAGWEQDPDVLDTWFSSALWPFSTMGWPEETDTLKAFYPTSVLVTGYDILFFWVARMMMMGIYAMGERQPFDVVALHGLVRDEHGKKMSKSRGNVVDPLAWIETYGADALRFTLARGANPGVDQAIAEDWVRGSKSFCSKLFNVTRFALMNGAKVPEQPIDRADGSPADRWILDRLDAVTTQTTDLLTDFQFAKAAEGLYHFAWDEVCDWYVELSKEVLYSDSEQADYVRGVLGKVLDTLLRLLHPFIPFVTEELWTQLTGGKTLVTAAWPSASATITDSTAAAEIAYIMTLTTEIRRFRSDQDLASSRRVPATFTVSGTTSADELGYVIARSANLTRLTEATEDFAASATLPVSLGASGITVTVAIDTSDVIDVAAEILRAEKGLAAAEKERETTAKKLANEAFLAKAPEAVVAKIRARAQAANDDIARFSELLERLSSSGA